jgi:hypothetical protein
LDRNMPDVGGNAPRWVPEIPSPEEETTLMRRRLYIQYSKKRWEVGCVLAPKPLVNTKITSEQGGTT